MTPWNAETAQAYGDVGEQSHVPILAHAISAAVDLTGKSVLDFGCGDGRLLARLVERHSARAVRCIDVSRDLLDLAKKQADALPGDLGKRFTFKRGDESILPTDQKFDIVLCSLMLMMLPGRDRVVSACRGMMQSLRTGGRAVVTVTHPCFRRARHAEFHNDLPQGFSYWQSGRAYDVVIDPKEKQVETMLSDYHWTLSDYVNALAEAGGAIESMAEVPAQFDKDGQPLGQPAYLLLKVRST